MTGTDKTIYDLIAENCDRFSTLDETDVTKQVLTDIPVKEWKRYVFPLVVNAVLNHRRGQTRSVEHRATGRRSAPPGRAIRLVGTPDGDAGALTIFLSLLNETIRFAGEDVLWGDMTLEQHKLRREWLDAHIQGTAQTRDLHDLAIAVCESRGVDSLRPLFTEGGAG